LNTTRAVSPAATSTPTTLVEDGTKIKGSLSSTVPVLVHGTVEGDVDSPAVTVSAAGSVSGVVMTKTLSSVGKISGDFDVDKATVAGAVAVKTVIRASEMEFKLEVKEPGKKIELRFGTATNK
jgi:cytoskeletal protein CcmA (bactofilin family)